MSDEATLRLIKDMVSDIHKFRPKRKSYYQILDKESEFP